MLYDGMLVLGLLLLVWIGFYFTLYALTGKEDIGSSPLSALFWPLAAAAMLGFHAWFWSHGGQTLGMRAWRIRLLTEDGTPVGPKQATVRYLLAWLSVLPLGLGYWWSLFDKRRRAWHDTLSHTMLVVLEKK